MGPNQFKATSRLIPEEHQGFSDKVHLQGGVSLSAGEALPGMGAVKEKEHSLLREQQTLPESQ